MAETALARRFLASWSPPTANAASLHGMTSNEDKVLAIGRAQIEAQKAAAYSLAHSNFAAAEIVAGEIRDQTAALEECLREYSERISTEIQDVGSQMSSAIEALGDRLCAHLGEIEWQLEQQTERLGAIFRVLRENRSNEARQLVEQGVRHYFHAQYERAEERFCRALKEDSTDYQVLMNLGLIAVHKGKGDEALGFFNDALRLPSRLDPAAKNRALLSIARVHYANGEHGEAFKVAGQAAQFADARQVDEIFILATYASLSGKLNDCLMQLERAIQGNPLFFSKSAVDPDLEGSRQAVLKLLSRIALEAREDAVGKLGRARSLLKKADDHPEAIVCEAERDGVRSVLSHVAEALPIATYSDLLRFSRIGENMGKSLDWIVKAEEAATLKQRLAEDLAPAAAKVAEAEADLARVDRSPPFQIRFWFLWHVGTLFGLILVLSTFNLGPEKGVMGWGTPLEELTGIWFWLGMPVWVMAQNASAWLAGERARQRALTIGQKSSALSDSTSRLGVVQARVNAEQKKIDDLLFWARGSVSRKPAQEVAGAR